jgi:type VI secretion system secreted protein VgrG
VPGVDVHAFNTESFELAYTGATEGDGRTPRITDQERPQEFVVLVGSGNWVTDITADQDPVTLEPDDWMDLEAEE